MSHAPLEGLELELVGLNTAETPLGGRSMMSASELHSANAVVGICEQKTGQAGREQEA